MQLTKFAAKKINILSQLFEVGNFKLGDDFKLEYNLTNGTSFQWLQLKHTISYKWETNIKQNPGNVQVLSKSYPYPCPLSY